MPHLLSLLLQTPAVAPASPVAIAGIALSAVALIFSFWAFTRKESREDGQTVNQRLKKMEVGFANQEARQVGFQTEIERVADHAARERGALTETLRRDIETLKEQHNSRFAALEKDSAEVQKLRDGMAEVRAEMKRLPKIEEKLDRLTEILTRKIA